MARKRNRGRNNQVFPQAFFASPVDFNKSYMQGQLIGNESRNLEFKIAQGNLTHIFNDAARYVCGFLNSGIIGTLMLGVSNDGRVQGVHCTHRDEDVHRLEIDQVMKSIKPAVFPNQYCVSFVKVDGCEDVKVIEIQTTGNEIPDRLYETKHSVYIRRDGSTQELKPNEIQQWVEQRYKKKTREMKNELNKKEQTIQTMSEKIQKQQDEINNLRKQAMEQNLQNQDGGNAFRSELQEIRSMLSQQAVRQAEAAELAAQQKQKSKTCVIL